MLIFNAAGSSQTINKSKTLFNIKVFDQESIKISVTQWASYAIAF